MGSQCFYPEYNTKDINMNRIHIQNVIYIKYESVTGNNIFGEH